MFEQKQIKNSNLTLQSRPNINFHYIDRRNGKKGSIKHLIRTAIKENKGRFTHRSLPMKYYGKLKERENRHGDGNSETEDELKKLILTVFAQNSIDYIRKDLPRNNLPTLMKNLKKELKKDSLSESVINDLFPRDPYPVRYNDQKDNLSNDYQPNSSIQEAIYEPTNIYDEPSYFDDNNFEESY